MLLIEIASIFVICSATDTISIIFNFIALAILCDFDGFVYESIKNESFKLLIEEEFVNYATQICHTTSRRCRDDELSTVKLPDSDEYRLLKIKFKDRGCDLKIMYVIYKIVKVQYSAVFFYFLPFTAVIISNVIPVLHRPPLD